MHRLIVSAVLFYWAVTFGSLAAISVSNTAGNLNEGSPYLNGGVQFLLANPGGLHIMHIALAAVAALFFWSLLALTFSDEQAFRDVEACSYAGAICLLAAGSIFMLIRHEFGLSAPALLMAALVISAAASRYLMKLPRDVAKSEYRLSSARHMAISAAHNSLLSHVSGRPIPAFQTAGHNVTRFPAKPNSSQLKLIKPSHGEKL